MAHGDSRRVTVYGHPVSQPSRAILWACKLKDLDIDFKLISPSAGEHLTPEFLAKFPLGAVPALDAGEIRICESPAICAYLSSTFGPWDDLLPPTPAARARVDEYLHWHHTNTRLATTEFVRPLLAQILRGTPKPPPTAEAARFTDDVLPQINSWLSASPYLAGRSEPSFCDILAYCELGQLHLLKLYSFEPFPHITAWLSRCAAIPHHDAQHAELLKLAELAKAKAAAAAAAAASTSGGATP